MTASLSRRFGLFAVCVGVLVSSFVFPVRAGVAEPDKFFVQVDDSSNIYLGVFQGVQINWSKIATLGSAYCRGVAIADFNNDGIKDFVVGRGYGYYGYMYLFINNGNNTFKPPEFINLQENVDYWVMDMTAADFNNDGNMDFFVNTNTNWSGMYLGDGKGKFTFLPMNNLLGSGRGVDAGDFNHDGKVDLVRAQYGYHNVQLFPGVGDGTFSTPISLGDLGGDNYGLACGDFDGDGHLDILADENGNGVVRFLRGHGNNTFDAPVVVASLNNGDYMAIDAFDYNNDSKLDIVQTAANNRRVYFYPGNGDGTFGTAVLVAGNSDNTTLGISAFPLFPNPADPRGVISPLNSTVAVNGIASFNGSTSSSPTGIASYEWDFGDGVTAPGINSPTTATHQYTQEGIFNVRLKIVAATTGYVSYGFARVTVNGAMPSVVPANLTFNESFAYGGVWPMVIDFSDYATDAEGIVAYDWDILDGLYETFDQAAQGLGGIVYPGWYAYNGTWSTTTSNPIAGDASFRQSDAGQSRTWCLYDRIYDTDLEFEVDFKILGGGGEEVILLTGAQNSYFNYEIIFRGRGINDLLVRRLANGYSTDLFNVPLGGPLTINAVHHAKIVRQGDLFEISFDNRVLGKLRDSAYMTGQVGLCTYQTDVLFDNVSVMMKGTSPVVTHSFKAGTYFLGLTVYDAAGQSDSDMLRMSFVPGTPPVANAGGPYSVDEFTGNAYQGGWEVRLNAGGTTDDFTPHSKLVYTWNLGTDTFNAPVLGPQYEYSAGVALSDGELRITGNSNWGNRYFGTLAPVERVPGAVFEWSAFAGYNESILGLKTNDNNYHYSAYTHGILLYYNTIYIYEYGSNVATPGQGYQTGVWYDYRIEMTDDGARYFFRESQTADWLFLYESHNYSDNRLRRAITVYDGITRIDNVHNTFAGQDPFVNFFGTGAHPVTLTVTDGAGLSHSAGTVVTTSVNQPPVARAGADMTANELGAIEGIWGLDFDGSASSDDHGGVDGIFRFEWDFNYDGTFDSDADSYSNAYPYHEFTAPGIYTVALRVTDHVLQTNIDTLTVTISAGTVPVAKIGGPYSFDEITGNAFGGAWVPPVDGSTSIDAESDIVEYSWDFGTDGFDGTNFNSLKWRAGEGVTQNDLLQIVGTSTWGKTYVFSNDSYPRGHGMAVEASIRCTPGYAMIGFKDTDPTHLSESFMPYAFYFNNGTLQIYENNSRVADVGPYQNNQWYDIRIELGQFYGAKFYWRTTGEQVWMLAYETTDYSYAALTRGVDVWSGTFQVDNLKEIATGPTPQYRIYEPGQRTIKLTVKDQALQSNTASTTLTLSPNNPPVADAGSDKQGNESSAVDASWTFTFSAANSTDDHGIFKYEWDWDYSPVNGFHPSGSTGVIATHTFTRLGLTFVAVRVTDHVLQSNIAFARVNLTAGQPPVANAGPDITVEVGYPAQFDGGLSTDDLAVVRYEWDFGGGQVGKGQTPTHAFPQAGDFEVFLKVFDPANQFATDTLTVHVIEGAIPTARAGGPYISGANGPPAYFDGRGSFDGDGTIQEGILRFEWDIDTAANSDGAGTTDDDIDLVGSTPFFTYTAPGTYNVKLTVIDGFGHIASDTTTVTVMDNLPPEVITVPWRGDPNLPHPTYSGREVTLKAIVRDAGTLTYQWNFGDASPPEPVQPGTVNDKYVIEAKHTYTGSLGKIFTAQLTVWDSAGLSSTGNYFVIISTDSLTTRSDLAVDEGLWYMHKHQRRPEGYWNDVYNGYASSGTAASIHAFEINGHRLNGNARRNPYVETVSRGFDYLFTTLRVNSIGVQPNGNPDSNGNGIGIDVNTDVPIYQTGIIMDALASSQLPYAVARTGPANVKGRYFRDLVIDMMDMYCWGQVDSGFSRGGWRYGWQSDADNSACQWAAIGILAAEDNFGVSVPQFVKNEDLIWLNTSFNGFTYGYTGPGSYAWSDAWHATTPSGLVQLAFCDKKRSVPEWQAAEAYIATNWPLKGLDCRNYYQHYAVAKAMRVAKPAPVITFQETGVDWFNDPAVGLRSILINQQYATGYWRGTWSQVGYEIGVDIATAWCVTMLTPTLFVQPPVAVINAPTVWGYDFELHASGSDSFHVDPTKQVVRYMWDFDNDGNFDFDTTLPDDPAVVWTYPDPHPGVPGDEPITVTIRLRVLDNHSPPQSDETTFNIVIAEPPHAPYAIINGPYDATQNIPFMFDGSDSFDIDPTDFITKYEWDFDNDDQPDFTSATPLATHTFATVGRQFIGLRVTDNGVLNNNVKLVSEWAYTYVDVHGNEPPIADGGGPYEVYEGEPLILDASDSTDPNEDALSFEWDFDGDNVADSTDELPIAIFEKAGEYIVKLTVSDSLLQNSITVSVIVLPLNDPPSFTSGGDVVVLEDSAEKVLANWATDILPGPDDEGDETGQAVDFIVTTDSTLFDVAPAIDSTGTLSFTPAPGASGTATITVQIHDDAGTENGGSDTSDAITFTITITPVNDAPQFTAGADVSALEGGAAYSQPWATGMKSGPDGEVDEIDQAIHFTALAETPALFLVQPAVAPDGTLTFTPADDISGTSTVTVHLVDDGGTADGGTDTSAPVTFNITIVNVNDPPAFTAGPNIDVVADSGAQTFNGWATEMRAGPIGDAAENSQLLGFLVTIDNPALFAAQPGIAPNGTLTFNSTAGMTGVATIGVKLRDSGGTSNQGSDTSATQTFTITISHRAPTITTLNPTSAEQNSAGFDLTVTGTGFYSDSLVLWFGAPLLTVYNSPTSLTATVDAGLLIQARDVPISVTNPAPGGATSNEVAFTVRSSIAPLITSPLTATAAKDANFSYTITATGSQPITFNATGLPPGLTFSVNKISGRPLQAGQVEITLSASNSAGSDTQTLVLTITAANNHPPAFISSPTATPATTTVGVTVNFSAAATDQDGDLLTYNWNFGDGVRRSGPTPTHAYSAPGLYAVLVAVTDGQANITRTLIVAVNSNAPAGQFSVKKATMKFDFAHVDKDALAFSGSIPVTQSAQAAGTVIKFNIVDLPLQFTLNDKGKAGDKTTSLSVLGVKKGTFPFSPLVYTLGVKNKTLFPALQNAGFVNDTTAKGGITVNVPVSAMVVDISYSITVPMNYQAIKGKTGKAAKK